MATTSQVAQILQVSAQTVRTYTRKFARHLSQEANPAPGQQRSFTDADIALLTAARSLLAEGLTYVQADDRLGAVDLGEFVPPRPQQAQAQMVPVDVIQVTIAPYVEERDRLLAQNEDLLNEVRELRENLGELRALREQIGEIRGRLAEVTRPRRPHWWTWLFGER